MNTKEKLLAIAQAELDILGIMVQLARQWDHDTTFERNGKTITRGVGTDGKPFKARGTGGGQSSDGGLEQKAGLNQGGEMDKLISFVEEQSKKDPQFVDKLNQATKEIRDALATEYENNDEIKKALAAIPQKYQTKGIKQQLGADVKDNVTSYEELQSYKKELEQGLAQQRKDFNKKRTQALKKLASTSVDVGTVLAIGLGFEAVAPILLGHGAAALSTIAIRAGVSTVVGMTSEKQLSKMGIENELLKTGIISVIGFATGVALTSVMSEAADGASHAAVQNIVAKQVLKLKGLAKQLGLSKELIMVAEEGAKEVAQEAISVPFMGGEEEEAEN
jgi:hypothetical protein